MVKELFWKNYSSKAEKHLKLSKVVAQTPFGWYEIRKYWSGKGYIMSFNQYLQNDIQFGGSHFWTLKEAKNWANEDFKRNVLDCLKAKN